MHFNSKSVLFLLYTIPSTLAAVNGRCTGRNGICISTTLCNSFSGQYFSGKCPNDPNNIKCCDNIPCEADDGRTGSCMFTNQCNDERIPGKCPGGSDYMCCVPKKLETTPCTYQGIVGKCMNVNACTGFKVPGLCPGGADIQCCFPKNTCNYGDVSGECVPTNQCSTGNTVSDICPGGVGITCCLPEPVETEIPCSYEGLSGTCKNVSECTGFRVAGLCPGDANNQCCFPRTRCSYNGMIGQCLPTSQCSGNTVSGRCPGGVDIKCCLPCCLPKPPNSPINNQTASSV